MQHLLLSSCVHTGPFRSIPPKLRRHVLERPICKLSTKVDKLSSICSPLSWRVVAWKITVRKRLHLLETMAPRDTKSQTVHIIKKYLDGNTNLEADVNLPPVLVDKNNAADVVTKAY